MLIGNMFVFILLAICGIAAAEPSDVRCCGEDHSEKMVDYQYVCVKNNVTTPLNLSCNSTAVVSDYDFTITDAGVLYIMLGDNEVSIEKNTYCILNRTTNSTTRAIVVCSDEEDETKILDESVLGYCMLVSSIFLFITVMIYSILPDIRDLQGKSIICLCLTAGIGECILGGMKVTEYSDMKLCAARGFFVYFFLLSSFFWTNAISIQLLLNIRRPTATDYGWKQFSWYALYAYGTPALLTIAMAVVNFLPGRHSKPGIGLNTCWFFNKTQQWYYMYSVMTALILANICIFVYLSFSLWVGSYSSSNVKSLRYKFIMTGRMIIIMGLAWIFEMISSLCQKHLIWAIIDIFNSLQGPLIFLVLVVLRRRVLKALHKQGYLDCISGAVEKHLAVGDDEEDVVQHASDVPFDEKLPYYMTSHNNIGNTKQ